MRTIFMEGGKILKDIDGYYPCDSIKKVFLDDIRYTVVRSDLSLTYMRLIIELAILSK